ncbi:hypothetical protein CEXT_416211 [Caerostris extrusa]|uniref:SOCS box domain-containing protein n=1 Tax=Caerostris extrusa TaxID=172846 RepID=A0AAV4MTU4_CAEEX|nr:hypothetical protein CEXT_416211 [Caerostris extrusa]
MQIVTVLANPLIMLLRLRGPFSQGRISERRYLLCLLVFCCNRHRVTEKLFYNNEDQVAEDILRLIWKSIPDPYLSLEELDNVYTSLKMSFTEHMFSENITEIFNYYSKTVSKSELHMEPRSLQHLCRMQIRESLSQNFQLPKGLKQLKMPSKFKTYLQLEL